MEENHKFLCSNHDFDSTKSTGCLLGAMIGDVLGSAVEGSSFKTIKQKYGLLKHFEYGLHMGIPQEGLRKGMYTDDMNSTLALASSLVFNKGLYPPHVALQYSKFWIKKPKRGYPDSAQSVLKAILKGADYLKTGNLVFHDGSFANGGAMKISPIGIAFRNATDDELLLATKQAIICSHTHPEAVDGAYLVAKAISILCKLKSPQDLSPIEFLKLLKNQCQTQNMKKQFDVLFSYIGEDTPLPLSFPQENDIKIVNELGDSFQIKTIEAVPCSLWAVINGWYNPEEGLIRAVNLGGDCDTIACITGSILGALHGTKWIPKEWFDGLENGSFGRDYCIQLSHELARLDLHSTLNSSPISYTLDEKQKILSAIQTKSSSFQPSEDFRTIDFFLECFDLLGDGISLTFEDASLLSKILLSKWELVDQWISFLETTQKTILYGLWMELFTFAEMMDKNFSRYDPISDNWVTVLKEFRKFCETK